VAEDLNEDFHRKARYEGAFILLLAKLHDQSLGLLELSVY
jgi:hypothetical protein